jgi:hypothetical protein
VDVDTLLDLLQWPAMAVTLAAAFLVGARHAKKRVVGFWTFIVSNALWIVWGVHDDAWALIALQVGLAAMNVRAILRNERGDPPAEQDPGGARRTT